jgi:hypothetical protein
VNPASIEVALALLAWVGVRRFLDSPSPTSTDAWWIAAPLALSIAIRPIAVVTACTALAVIEVRGGPRGRRAVLVAPVVAATAGVAAWGLAVGTQLDDPRTAVHRSFLSSLADSLGSLGEIGYDAVGSLGWNEFLAPRAASIAWTLIWLVMAVVVARNDHVDDRRTRVAAALVWGLALVASPLVFETAMASSIGPIWQGRYSIPVLIGILAIAPWSPGRRGRPAVIAVAGAAEIVTYWSALRRYAVGSHGSWWFADSFGSSAWLGPSAWLAVHVATVAAAAVLMLRPWRAQVK